MCADWNQLFRHPANIIRQPDPLAFDLVRELSPGGKVLDLGCGGGRHLVFLARAGLIPIGCDLAPRGLEIAGNWLRDEAVEAPLMLSEMAELPLADNSFAGAISINVINHATWSESCRAVDDVHRILLPGAPFFFLIIGREDFRCGEGDEIEPCTFVPHQGLEAGVPHHYFDYPEIEQMVGPFSRMEIQERRRPYDENDPIFGRDPRARCRPGAFCQHWAVKAWK